jgi:tetratricopeptide (TPR) repeat protein
VNKKLLAIFGLILVLLVVGLGLLLLTLLKLQQHLVTSATPTYTANELANTASQQIQQGDYVDAETYLKRALAQGDDHTYRDQLAVVEYDLKKYPAAVTQYQMLISQDQDVAFAENGLGNTYRDWGNHVGQAEAAYVASYTADTGYVAAYSNLALLQNSQGQKTEALSTLGVGIAATDQQALITLKNQLEAP